MPWAYGREWMELLSLTVELYDRLLRDNASISTVLARDPNEKVGPAGIGPLHVVSVGEKLHYTIYFENVITATAPAQEVFVSDYLDPSLNWHSFQVSEVAFGDQVIAASESAGEFRARATIPDYRSEVRKSWWVDINAQLNYQTGQVNWTFRTLDQETEALPEDALAGFLPPNDSTGRGEGHVSFSIRPQAGLALGRLITNSASIVFDVNEPIHTNMVSNTIGLVTDLALTKDASPQQARVGSALTYTLSVHNNGPDAASGVVVTDALPAGVAFGWASASQGTCTGASTVVCSLGTIHSGADATVTIVVTPTAQGTLTNTASVATDSADPDMVNNSAEAVTSSGLSGDLDGDCDVDIGDIMAVASLWGSNAGDPSYQTLYDLDHDGDIDVVDIMRVAVHWGESCSSGTATVTLAVAPVVTGILSNTATVTSDVADPDMANNQATVTLTIVGHGYQLLLPVVLKKH